MKNNNKILILFSNIKGNIGDFAILHAELNDLKYRYPEHEIHVAAHGFLTVDEERFQAFQKTSPPHLHPWKTPDIKAPKLIRVISRLGLKKIGQFLSIKSLQQKLLTLNEVKSVKDYDAIYIGGGGQWVGQMLGINMFSLLCAISKYNSNIYTYPFSIYPEITKYNSPHHLRHYFSKIKCAPLVRDSGSQQVLNKIGVKSTLGADCVFSLADYARDIKSNTIPTNQTITFAITKTNSFEYNQFDLCISSLLNFGFRVNLVTTCESEDSTHLKLLSKKHKIPYIAPMTWQEVVAEFKSSSMVVSNRLHCIIFSFFSRVPAIPLNNRDKVTSLCRDASLPISIIKISDFTPEIAQQVIEKKNLILKSMDEYIQLTKQLQTSPILSKK